MAGEDQNPESQFPTAQMPNTPLPPGVAPAAPAASAQAKGPFSSYLDPSQVREPTHVASKERPSGYMGAGGKFAMLADQFLGGLAKGRANAYNKSIKDQAAQYGRFDQALDDIGKMPDVTDADKRKLAQPILDAKLAILRGEINPDAVDGKDGKKGGGKKGKDQEHPNPIVHFIGQMADKVAGPGAQPQRMSGEYVSQVLGQVYPQMHALIGQRQQTEEANKEYMAAAAEAIGAVGADKEVNVADLWKSERFQAAHAKLAGLTKDGKISPDMVKPLEDMMKRRNAKPAEVELQDGSKIPVTVESDGTVKSGNTVMPVGSYKQLLWPGRMATETKPKPSALEVKADHLKERYATLMGVKDSKDLPPDVHEFAEEVADSSTGGALRTQFDAAIIRQGAKVDVPAAIKAARLKLAQASDTTVQSRLLGIVEKQLDITKKEAAAKVYDAPHAKEFAAKVVNDVHDEGASTYVRDLKVKAADPNLPIQEQQAAVSELKKLAKANLPFYGLSDEKRQQISDKIDSEAWNKVEAQGKKASGKPGGHIGSLTADVAKLQAGGTPAAAGTPAATPAAPMRSSTPPGQDKPAPKPAAAASAAPAAPKAKVLGTESQLRVKAKAAGRTPAEIDQMVKEYKQAGYIQ